MTARVNNSHININQTIAATIRDAQRAIAERCNREVRYQPDFNGEVTVTIIFKGGVPRGIIEAARHSSPVDPVLD